MISPPASLVYASFLNCGFGEQEISEGYAYTHQSALS
jgi:hypothetical protein